MNSKNIIIGILFLTTVAGGIYGWAQHRQVNALNTQVAALAKDSARRSQRSAAAQRTASPDAAAADTSQQTAAADSGASQRSQRPDFSAIRGLMQSPKAAPLIAAQQRAMLDSRYAPLFKSLNLPPDQLAKFKDLLVDRQNAARDVMSVAREQGLDPRNDRSEIQQLIQQAQADVDNNIASVIGTDKLAQYQNYDQTAPQRAVASQLAQSLSYTSEPLSPEQNDQLVALLAQNTPAPDGNGGNRTFVVSMGGGGPGGPPGGFGSFGGMTLTQGVPITNDVIDAAQSFLTPSQVDALRQMQAQQAGQQQLQQMFMGAAGLGGGSGGGGGGSATTQSRHHHGGGGGN